MLDVRWHFLSSTFLTLSQDGTLSDGESTARCAQSDKEEQHPEVANHRFVRCKILHDILCNYMILSLCNIFMHTV